MTRRVDHRDIVRMLRDAARRDDLSLADFLSLGRSDELDSPVLRDLWLIWGEELTDSDVDEPVSAP